MKARTKFAILAVTLGLTAGPGSGAAFSQIADIPEVSFDSASKQGLYRDMDGNLWCGGRCGTGQQCCQFTILPAE
jgi:hypothetical protein